MTNQEIDLLLLADTPENIFEAHGHTDFAAYVRVLMRNDAFAKEREYAPLFARWVLSSTRVKGRREQRNTVVGNLLRARILQVLSKQPRDLMANDRSLARLQAAASAGRATRKQTRALEGILETGINDSAWLHNAPELRSFLVRAHGACEAHSSFSGRGWAHVAALYDHPNAHRRMIHMLTHKSHVGRPRLD